MPGHTGHRTVGAGRSDGWTRRSYQPRRSPPTGAPPPSRRRGAPRGPGPGREAQAGAHREVLERGRLPVEGGEHGPTVVGVGPTRVESRAAARRARRSPSATSTSVASRTGGHPSASSRLVPAAAGLRTDPGTAITWMDRSSASRTVCIDPPVACDSTTTTTSARRGDDAVAGREAPCGRSDAERRLGEQHSVHPHPLPQVSVARGVDHVEPAPHDADGRAPGIQHAPVGGAVDAEGEPRDDRHPCLRRVAPQLARHPGAAPVQRRVPTIATRVVPSASRSPCTNSTAGGSGSDRRRSG